MKTKCQNCNSFIFFYMLSPMGYAAGKHDNQLSWLKIYSLWFRMRREYDQARPRIIWVGMFKHQQNIERKNVSINMRVYSLTGFVVIDKTCNPCG
ncbi:hypothetical protein D3C75_731880 [compost metagenome]